jgi:hypothetical protein
VSTQKEPECFWEYHFFPMVVTFLLQKAAAVGKFADGREILHLGVISSCSG